MMDDAAGARLQEVLELARQSLELLDQAVGGVAKLKPADREQLRDHLVPPRTHLRDALDSLSRQIESSQSRRSPPGRGRNTPP